MFSSQRLTVEQRSLLKLTLPVFVLISHLHCNHEACHYDPEPPRRINPPHLPPSSRPPASAFILYEASLINGEASVDHFPLTVPRYVQEYRKSLELLLSFPPPPVRSSARCFQRAGFLKVHNTSLRGQNGEALEYTLHLLPFFICLHFSGEGRMFGLAATCSMT